MIIDKNDKLKNVRIPKDRLKIQRYYWGEGRLGNVAMWNGKVFLAPGYSCGFWMLDEMEYGAKGFDPLHIIGEE